MSVTRGATQVQAAESKTSIVFDLDGTLIDSCPGIGTSLSAAFLSAGRTMPATDLRTVVGPAIRVIATRIEPTLTEAELVQIERTYRAAYDSEGWRDTVLFGGVADTLDVLHRAGIPLFIVTNKPRLPTEKILSYLGLRHLFREILTRDSRTPGYGSKSEMLAELLRSCSLEPRTTFMMGDTLEDQEAAAANSLRFLYATYGYGSIKAAPLAIANFSELPRLLAEHEFKVKNRTIPA